ncbi:lysis protein [Salmonella enterica]|nr:lysis protein [Salmonella enterica]
MNRVATGVIVVLLIVAAVLAWTTDHYHGNAVKYKDQRDTATHNLKLANATITDMQKRQRDVAELDARYTKELADANATIETLRADVSAGRKRLQVAATCPKSTTGASGMGDGESPRLTADAELNYYRLRSGIDRITAQVNYLQEYIRTQCLK